MKSKTKTTQKLREGERYSVFVLPFRTGYNTWLGFITSVPILFNVIVPEDYDKFLTKLYYKEIRGFAYIPAFETECNEDECYAYIEDNNVYLLSNVRMVHDYSIIYEYFTVMRHLMWVLKAPLRVEEILQILGKNVQYFVAKSTYGNYCKKCKVKAFMLFTNNFYQGYPKYVIFLTPKLVKFLRKYFIREPRIYFLGEL